MPAPTNLNSYYESEDASKHSSHAANGYGYSNGYAHANGFVNRDFVYDIQENDRKRENRESRSRNKDYTQETIVVVGTGDLGRALVLCLVRAGYRVVVASRKPEKNRAQLESAGAEVEAIPVALRQSSTILLAIPYEGFSTLCPDLLAGKVVIDVSNRPLNYDPRKKSLAVRLQKQLPRSKVVKAFNTLSAYALQSGLTQGSKEIPICSNHEEAKATVMTLARNLGFSPIDYGNLSNAKSVEDIPLKFFEDWTFPLIFAFTIWCICFILLLFRMQLCPNFDTIQNGGEWNWSLFNKLPTFNLHFSLGLTAITLVASCYFPGVLASYIQLYRQTKYSKFPNWLDIWLKRRKQLGLLAPTLVIPHFILAIISRLGHAPIDWNESLYYACGAVAFLLLVILAVTSLPSVTATLTWREFSFVQRYLGWWCLFLAVSHVVFMTWGFLFDNSFRCVVIPSTSQIIIIFPLLTLLLKMPLLIPFVDSRLQKIRRGYEGKKAQTRS